MSSETFLWHDYETFGADPRRDRPCQFAALRTDSELEPVEDPVVVYCQPTRDLLPAPEACMITGITPQLAMQRGIPEFEFADRIFRQMSVAGTCSVGYNNFRFDDEVSRFLFWRNFIDPYAREYKNGNSRFDLIDLLRLTRALRPDGMQWCDREDGTASFRLEDLARVNGMEVENAHDALVDVRNTLGLARLLRTAQPRLWHWALGLRARHQVEKLLAPGEMLLHASSRFPAQEFCLAPVLPLFRHPEIASQWLVWNLRIAPDEFLDLDQDLLPDLLWTAAADLPEGLQRLPVKWVRSNRCPMLAPMSVLDPAAAERTGIDAGAAKRNADRLRQSAQFISVLAELTSAPRASDVQDAETALYDGFVSASDRGMADRVQSCEPASIIERLGDPTTLFDDERLTTLLIRYLGRHAESSLDASLLTQWNDFCRRKLLDDPDLAGLRLPEYLARIDVLRRQRPEHSALLDQLEAWGRDLVDPGRRSP
ncbi:MAG: exodeoxyribonuclease I [Wenzhouxiangellaceae bacterium]